MAWTSWPTGDQYHIAMSMMDRTFKNDPDLRECKTLPHPVIPGMPWFKAGNFAIVYQVESQTNPGQKYAVRAFSREVTTQQQTYQAISQHISGISWSFMVGFDYQPDGMHMTGSTGPFIKMDWVTGDTFGDVVEKHHGNADLMYYLAAQHRGMCSSLLGEGMAHGDKQHGNGIVDINWKLILVDYDDMFVPSLAGQKSIGYGVDHYQHPDRTVDFFSESVDNFSDICIYLSLGALADNKGLIKYKFEDNIIFTKDNFLKPGNDPIWRELLASRDSLVVNLTELFIECCKGKIEDVPTLTHALRDVGGSFPAGKAPQTATPPPPRSMPTAQPPRPTPQPAVVVHRPPPAPHISLPATSVAFPDTRVGTQTPATGTFDIHNSGTGDLHLTSVSVVSGPFAVAPLTQNTVTPGGNVTVNVEFTPTGRGTATGSVEVRSDDPNNRVLAVSLSGRGLAPEISVTWPGQPGAMDFGQIRVGSAAPRSITVQNIGDADLGQISITGPANMTVGQYAATLAAGAAQDVEVVFTPAAEGIFQGQIQITSDDPGPGASPALVNLTGEGFIPPPVKICKRCGDENPQTAAWCRCGNYLRSWRNYELLRP